MGPLEKKYEIVCTLYVYSKYIYYSNTHNTIIYINVPIHKYTYSSRFYKNEETVREKNTYRHQNIIFLDCYGALN